MARRRQGSFDCFALIIQTEYCSQLSEMAANSSPSRLPHPWKSTVPSRYRPFAEFGSVAGASAPAFVERASPSSAKPRSPRVAGASAPAFVERTPTIRACRATGSVAGASAPAFVEHL